MCVVVGLKQMHSEIPLCDLEDRTVRKFADRHVLVVNDREPILVHVDEDGNIARALWQGWVLVAESNPGKDAVAPFAVIVVRLADRVLGLIEVIDQGHVISADQIGSPESAVLDQYTMRMVVVCVSKDPDESIEAVG